MPRRINLSQDIAKFVESQPPGMPYSKLAGLVRDQFGEARAVDSDTLRLWWQQQHPVLSHSKIERDIELQKAILDVAGRMSGDEILLVLAEQFPASRVPSRSALYRFIARKRSAA